MSGVQKPPRFGFLGAAEQVMDWAKTLVAELNRYPDNLASLPGPFANDGAAAAANVRIGAGYIDTAGIARRRIV